MLNYLSSVQLIDSLVRLTYLESHATFLALYTQEYQNVSTVAVAQLYDHYAHD